MATSNRLLERLDDKFTLDDVGSSLLEDLAKGLYKPDEVIREYVQNAVDAHRLWSSETGSQPEGPIQIEVRGDKISILDYGIGMDEQEVKRVKSIAVSKKPGADVRLTGHKGVGIWAGLSYFENLTLYTTKRGSDRAYELTLYFKRIVDAISDNASIGDVLDPNYSIDVYEAEIDDHYTDVTLGSPTRSIDCFVDGEKVGDAIRRICPCQIDPTFAFHDNLTEWYSQHGLELFPIAVNGQLVHRSYPGVVEGFESSSITVDDNPVAEYWLAVNKRNAALPVKEDQLVGFRVIQDGFTIGDTNLYGERQRVGFDTLSDAAVKYPNWYIGEIHVTLPELRPNLRRREFEESELTRQFVQRVRRWYQDLENKTRVLSRKRTLLRTYSEHEEHVGHLRAQGAPLVLKEDDGVWLMETRRSLMEHDQRLEQHKGRRKVHYEVEALRDSEVKSARRRILLGIVELQSHVPPTDVASSPKVQESAESPNGTRPTRLDHRQPPEEICSPARHRTSAGDTVDDSLTDVLNVNLFELEEQGETEERYVSFDVVSALLEEILSEQLPDDSELRTSILNMLQERIRTVISNDRQESFS